MKKQKIIKWSVRIAIILIMITAAVMLAVQHKKLEDTRLQAATAMSKMLDYAESQCQYGYVEGLDVAWKNRCLIEGKNKDCTKVATTVATPINMAWNDDDAIEQICSAGKLLLYEYFYGE